MKFSAEDIEEYRRYASPLYFIEKMWGLVPQPVKLEKKLMLEVAPPEIVKAEWFEPFEHGKHLTWQQYLILRAVESANRGEGAKRISVAAGHGIGKSMIMALLVLWYLFRYPDSQIPCTAPTSDQIHDVLWKEIKKWLDKMPQKVSQLYEHTDGYVRMKESPKTWFARAKTAKKEQPEALAGIHADYVLCLVDEASGVPEEVFNTAEGMLTNKNVLLLMISNPTRLIGYFYDSHHKDKSNWQVLQFSSTDSPIVEQDYSARIAQKHGADSDEYRVRVLGKFPKEDMVDNKGYVPLLTPSMVHTAPEDYPFAPISRLGVDPSGEGSDETVAVIRDNFCARILFKEKTSTPLTIAQKVATVSAEFKLNGQNITIDNFGEGANVAVELAKQRIFVNPVNVGIPADDDTRFINKRAEASWRLREWLVKGGQLIGNGWDDLFTVRYRAELNGKLKIMGKEEMRREGIASPNVFDALMLTFVDEVTYGQIAKTFEPVGAWDRYEAI